MSAHNIFYSSLRHLEVNDKPAAAKFDFSFVKEGESGIVPLNVAKEISRAREVYTAEENNKWATQTVSDNRYIGV